jgi:hypothetical protein
MRTLILIEQLGTPNAILHSFGMKIYDIAIDLLHQEEKLILDFSRLHHISSAFTHASIGNLYRDLGSNFENRIQIIGVERPEWQEKILDAINLAQNPELVTETQSAVATLFED